MRREGVFYTVQDQNLKARLTTKKEYRDRGVKMYSLNFGAREKRCLRLAQLHGINMISNTLLFLSIFFYPQYIFWKSKSQPKMWHVRWFFYSLLVWFSRDILLTPADADKVDVRHLYFTGRTLITKDAVFSRSFWSSTRIYRVVTYNGTAPRKNTTTTAITCPPQIPLDSIIALALFWCEMEWKSKSISF